MTTQEEKHMRKEWTRRRDMKGRSSESNNSKKVKLRTGERHFLSHQSKKIVKRHNNLMKTKRNNRRFSKSRECDREATLGLQNLKQPIRSSHNTSSVDARDKESRGYKDKDRRRTRICRCSCYLC